MATLVTIACAARAACAQVVVRTELALTDVIHVLQNGMPETQIASLAQKRCLTFAVAGKEESALRTLGASERLIVELRGACRRGGSAAQANAGQSQSGTGTGSARTAVALKEERAQNAARVNLCLREENVALKRSQEAADALAEARKAGGKKAGTRDAAAKEQRAADEWLERLARSSQWRLQAAQRDTAKWNKIVRAFDAFDAAGRQQDEVTKRCAALQR